MKRSHIAAVLVFICVSAFWWLRTEDYELLRVDDLGYVTENTILRSGLNAKSIRWAVTDCAQNYNWHPYTWLSLMADAALSDGNDLQALSAFMHRHNAVIHGLSAALLLVLMLTLIRRFGIAPQLWMEVSAVGLALFWALHPLRAECVCWVTERKEILCTLFMLLTMLCHLGSRRGCGLKSVALSIAAPVFFALALLSKSVAVTLPVILMTLDFCLIPRCAEESAGKSLSRVLRTHGWLWIYCLLCCAVAAAMTLISQRPAIEGNQETAIWIRAANGFGAYATHLKRLLLPTGIYFHYRFVDHVLWGNCLMGAALLGAAAWAAIRHLRRGGAFAGIGLMALAWCGVGLLPMCGILRVGVEMNPNRFGHWVGAGFVVCVAVAIAMAGRALNRRMRWLTAVVLMAFAAGYGAWGWHFAEVFRSNFALFSHTISHDPAHPQALSHVGSEYAARFNRPDLAIECYERSLRALCSDDVGGQLATVLATRNAPGDFERVKKLCQKVADDPVLDENGMALTALATVAMHEHRWDDAIRFFRLAIARQELTHKPTEDNWMRVAMCYFNSKRYAQAKPIFATLAVSHDPRIKAKAIELFEVIMKKEQPLVFR